MKPLTQNTLSNVDRNTKVTLSHFEALFGSDSDKAFTLEPLKPQHMALIKRRHLRAKRSRMRRAAFGF